MPLQNVSIKGNMREIFRDISVANKKHFVRNTFLFHAKLSYKDKIYNHIVFYPLYVNIEDWI